MRKLVSLAMGIAAALPAATAAAQVTVPAPLPVKEFATIGPGRNPLLGFESGPRNSVHYLSVDAVSGLERPRFWNVASRVTGADWYTPWNSLMWGAYANHRPVGCAWSEGRVFCTFWGMRNPLLRDDDIVVMYDLVQNRYVAYWFSVQRADGVDPYSVPPVTIGDAQAELATIEIPAFGAVNRVGEIRLLEDAGGSALWNYAVAAGAVDEELSHAKLNPYGFVVYQHRDANGAYTLNLQGITSGIVQATAPSPSPYNPSDTLGMGTAVERSNPSYDTVSLYGFDGGWVPPGGYSTPDPTAFGCESFYKLKSKTSSGPLLWLVRGKNCSGEASTLIALKRDPFAEWEAFRVGSLSSAAEYDVLDDEIVFVNADGVIQWVRHALWAEDTFEFIWEQEPNDTLGDATHLPVSTVALYSSGGNGELASGDQDWWRFDLEEGVTLGVQGRLTAGTSYCHDGSPDPWSFELLDSAGNLVATSSGMANCPALQQTITQRGTYYVRVNGQGALSYELNLGATVLP